jgi:diguanylate cyclase (GGDEF)-like protein/PAS domain S-box-containing protein
MDDSVYINNRNKVKKGTVLEKRLEDELISLKKENEDLLSQYDDVFSQLNTLVVEAEIAHLEFNQIFDAVGDPLWIVSNDYTILRINKSFINLFELESKNAAIGKKCYEVLASPICQTINCPLKKIKNGRRRVELDIELEITDGNRHPFWMTSTPLFGVANEIIGAVEQFKEITERKNYEEALKKANLKLERLAVTDGLTQLANRRMFDETLKKEWLRMRRDQQPLSVIIGDIDFFKSYNDCYGHQEGDACLKAVAGCIKSSVHRSSDMVARYGGEEFVALLPNTPSEGAFRVAEKMRTAVSSMNREHARSEVQNFVTISLGVATLVPPVKKGNPEDLVKLADDALYASKKAGRNLVTVKDLS